MPEDTRIDGLRVQSLRPGILVTEVCHVRGGSRSYRSDLTEEREGETLTRRWTTRGTASKQCTES